MLELGGWFDFIKFLHAHAMQETIDSLKKQAVELKQAGKINVRTYSATVGSNL